MPECWYNIRDNIVRDGDSPEVIKRKEFNRRITAAYKPYFMTYVYPALRAKNNAYIQNNEHGAIIRFRSYGIQSIQDLISYEPKTPEMIEYLDYYNRFTPVGNKPCVVNRICWLFEKAFEGRLKKYSLPPFDYSILKSDVGYSKKSYSEVFDIYQIYQRRIEAFQKKARNEKLDSFDIMQQRKIFVDHFRRECEEVCTNENELCDIVLDICYKADKTKQFAWDICGGTILKNLLRNKNGKIRYPQLTSGVGDFEYCGEQFVMCEKVIVDEDSFERERVC